MGISFGSINTGLPKDIVQQIINAEKIPIRTLEGRKDKIVEKKKLVDELIKLVTAMDGEIGKSGSAKNFREFKLEFNKELVDVTVDKNVANPGSYQFEVVQLAQKSSAMSSGFADKDNSYVGVGFVQYYLPNGDSKEIYVDQDNASLTGIANLINTDPSSGLRATVVNDGSGSDTPWRLLISLQKSGDEEIAEFPYLYFVDGEQDFYWESEREAQDAIVKLDGFELEFPSNKIKDLIPGVVIDLKKAKPGEEFPIIIGEDAEAITSKTKDLVEKINEVLKFVKAQNTLDEKSDTTKTLGGDIILTTLESRIRTAVFKDVMTEAGPRRFGDLGVRFQRDGLLKLDEKKFQSAIAENYQIVSQVLTGSVGPDGIASQGFLDYLKQASDSSLRMPDGLLQSRKRSLQSNVEQIDRRIADKQRHIDQKERVLKDKFARLEATISQIRNQGAGLAGMGGGAPSPVQELG